MARALRITPAGVVFHVVNRAIESRVLFLEQADYDEFYGLLLEAGRRFAIHVCAFCLMPNHWHLVLWPTKDQEVSAYIHWLTTQHSLHIRRKTDTVGRGHVYQDRFHSFPVQTGRYYCNVVRYVEANALEGQLVSRAEDWPWSSLPERRSGYRLITEGPVDLPADWVNLVNITLPKRDLDRMLSSERGGRPYGSSSWTKRRAHSLSLEQTLRAPGRPFAIFARK